MTTVSDVSKVQNQYQTSTQNGNPTQIGNVLAGSNNVSQNSQLSEVKQTKKFREDYINKNIISAYKLNKEDVYQLLSNIGYAEDKLFNVNDDEFKQIVSLLTAVVEFIIRPSEEGDLSERYKNAADKVAELKKLDFSTEQMVKNIEEFGGDDIELFEYIWTKCYDELSSYSSIDKVPEDLLIKCINKTIVELKKPENKSRNIGDSIQIFKSLLFKTKDENIATLWNAFVKTESSKNIALSAIYSLNKYEKRDELAKFIEGLSDDTLKALGVNKEDLNIIRIAKTGKMNDEQIAAVTNRSMEIIGNVINNNPQLLRVLIKFIEAKKNNTEVSLTPEEQSVYDSNRDVIDELCGYNLGVANNDVASEKAKQDHFDAVNPKLKEAGIIEYFYNEYKSIIDSNPELFANKNVDEVIKNIDKYTNGEFSEYSYPTERTENSDNKSQAVIGLEQKTTQETYWSAVMSVDEKIQQLYQEQKEEQKVSYVIEKNNTRNKNSLVAPFQKFCNVQNLNATELCEGIAKKIIKFSEVLDKYNDLTQSAKDFVKNLFESMSADRAKYFIDTVSDNIKLDLAKTSHKIYKMINPEDLSYDARVKFEMV